MVILLENEMTDSTKFIYSTAFMVSVVDEAEKFLGVVDPEFLTKSLKEGHM